MGIAIPQVITDRSGAQVIDGSLNFNGSTSPSLTRTVGSGNQTTWTWSAWVKTDPNQVNGSGGFAPMFFGGLYNTSGQQTHIAFGGSGGTSGQLLFTHYSGSSYTTNLRSSSRFRDTGWYHIVVVFDSNNSTSGDRARVYVNGERVTSWSSETYPSSGGTTWINDSTKFHGIGKDDKSATENCFDGLMSQVYFLDGQALDASYFGFTDPLTNTWKPKKYTGTFTGTNTFYLPFDGNSPIGEDKSGIVTPNNGSIWSNSLTVSSGFRSSEPKTNAFDGDTSSICSAVNDGTITFTSPVTFASNSTIRVFLHGGDHTVTVNGGSNQTISAGSFQTVTYSNSGNATFTMTFKRDTSADTGVRAIEIDGVILKDGQIGNNWTPVKFGGSVALDNPQVSGARPILNTTQGGARAGVGVFGSKQNVGYAVTVYNDGGGNKYYIDGVKQDTVTGLIRGATYTFDTSDSTVSSHPFRFSATSNGSHGGGSEYTNGVAAITGAATTITVPHDAPNTLYYYCTSHSGMGADITGITTNEKLADQYASHCVLALPLVDDHDVCTSIACTSTTKALTSYGTIAASNIESNIYSGSFLFDGDSDYFTFAPGGDFAFGTADFTIECWCYSRNRGTYDYIIEGRNSGQTTGTWTLAYGWSGANPSTLEFAHGGDGTLLTCPTAHNPEAGRWFHVAITRSGTSLKMFIDGVEVTSATNSSNFSTSPSTSYIGRRYTDEHYWDGYMQDIRVYKGVAKYTSDFVVPSRSPNVLPDTPSGVSGESKLTKIIDGAVDFEGTAKSKLRVNDSTDLSFGSNDFCIEFFYYNEAFDGTYDIIFDCMDSNRSGIQLAIETDNDYRIEVGDGANNWIWQSTGFPSKGNKWTHFALTRDGNTFRAYEDGILLGTQTSSTAVGNPRSPAIGGYSNDDSTNYGFNGYISNFRIVNGSSVYSGLTISPLPTAPLTNITNTKLLCCQSNKSSSIAAASPNISGSINDGTAWSSIVTGPTRHQDRVSNAFDGTTSGPGAIPAYPGTLTFAPGLSSISSVKIYGYYAGSGVTLHVNGSQQSPSSGAFTLTISTSTLDSVVWTATNGFNYMRIDAIEVDSTVLIDPVVAPDDSHADATTFNPFNDINTVRGQETGYATFNPLDSGHDGAAITFSDGNLKAAFPSTSGTGQAPASIYVSSGKWYCEYYLESVSDLTSVQYGIVSPGSKRASYIGKSDTTDQYGWEPEIDRAYNNGTNTTPTGKTFTSQWSVAGMALDLDNGTWEMFIDGFPTTTIYSGISGTYTFAVGDTMSSGYHTHTANFGQKPFKFPPPDGFQPLNAANVRPVNVISRPDQYVGISTWSGDSAASRNINIGMKPDFVWVKNRFVNGRSHYLYDSVRGFGANKEIVSNTSDEEGSTNHLTQNHGYVSGNTINGFTLTAGATNSNYTNQSGQSYIAWAWKAGGNKNTFNVDDVGYSTFAASGTTAGTITPTGTSIGTKQGFSIIKYTGTGSAATLPHGLTQAPEFVLVKNRDSTYNWAVYHKSLTSAAYYVFLNNSDSQSNSFYTFWNSTDPSSTVISLGADTSDSNVNTNKASQSMVCYAWHSVPGLQKFGSYTGNLNADGPYVELGFKPALIIVKEISPNAGHYYMYDSTRSTINPTAHVLWANQNYDENSSTIMSAVTSNNMDMYSSGFKMRSNKTGTNRSGGTYIYMAWAEAPSIDLYGGGANAR